MQRGQRRVSRAQTSLNQLEWPTIGLLVLVHGSWAAILMLAGTLTPLISLALLVPVLVLHSSLQHEVLHGHPFRAPRWNEASVALPLGFLIPYRRFRDQHLAHHFDPNLTDPYDDPESNYLDPAIWRRMGRPARALFRANTTLAGRMVFGPMISLLTLWTGDVRRVWKGDRIVRTAYLLHILGAVPVVLAVWLSAVPVWGYLVACYLALSILKIRTFLEHRAEHHVRKRSVVVEDTGPLAFLFLNNNFHALHHARPGLPWYQLPAVYAQDRAAILERNGGYRYRSYAAIIGAHLWRAKDPVLHPHWPGADDPAPQRTPPLGQSQPATLARPAGPR